MAPRRFVNNAFYDDLGERWFEAQDDPVALLRAEGAVKNAWVEERLLRHAQFRVSGFRVLDLGCGAGFLANRLAASGFEVAGLDQSRGSLRMARGRGRAFFHCGDALKTPWKPESFDAVCALDFLEHVENPGAAVAEASRLLRPGGLFFFHTFNRNLLAYLVAVKGVEWFVRHTPKDMHVLRLFIKPRELDGFCRASGMRVREWTGLGPDIFRPAFWRLLLTRVVPRDFRFRLVKSRALSYMGVAEKRGIESKILGASSVTPPETTSTLSR